MSEIISFDDAKMRRYIQQAMHGFMIDPADSDYQRGYLAALLNAWSEGLNGATDDRIAALRKQAQE